MCSLTAVKTARCLFLPDLKDTGIPILSIFFLEIVLSFPALLDRCSIVLTPCIAVTRLIRT